MKTVNKILIVDDNESARDSLDMLLSTEGYRLFFAEDGKSALNQILINRPDLVLLDVMMPEMDGYEVCRRIRNNPATRELPVILVTALDDRESRIRGIRAGADDFVCKPFDRTELRLKVQNITNLNRYRALTNAKDRFEWIADKSDAAIIVINGADQILYCNETAKSYLSIPENYASDPVSFLPLARQRYTLEPDHLWRGWPRVQTAEEYEQRYLILPGSSKMKTMWLEVLMLEQEGVSNEYLISLRNISREVTNWRDSHLLHNAVTFKLRTPLNTIRGGLDILSDPRRQLPPDDVSQLAGLSLSGLTQLQVAIDDILQYANSSTLMEGDMRCEVGTFIEIAQRNTNDSPDASLLVSCPETMQDKILRISERGATVIISELFENSRKFHPSGAPVIRMRLEEIEPETIQILITDDGTVINPDELRYIWQAYYQVEHHGRGDKRGMGLGLALVRSIVLESGGSCTIDNLPNNAGVEVKLKIPLAQNQDENGEVDT